MNERYQRFAHHRCTNTHIFLLFFSYPKYSIARDMFVLYIRDSKTPRIKENQPRFSNKKRTKSSSFLSFFIVAIFTVCTIATVEKCLKQNSLIHWMNRSTTYEKKRRLARSPQRIVCMSNNNSTSLKWTCTKIVETNTLKWPDPA